MNAILPTRLDAPEHGADRERRAALLASLVRGLTEAMLASVQRTTEQNWTAARVLLARSQAANLHECAESSTMTWRWSWRSFQICATTAAQVLDLCRDHAQSTTDDLWRVLRQAGVGLPGIDGQRSLELQAALRAVDAAFTAYIGAVGGLQRGLVALAQGENE
jgi:hypothetical protein